MKKYTLILLLCICANFVSAQGTKSDAVKNMIVVGAYRGADFFNFHGENEKPTGFTGLTGLLKIDRYTLSIDASITDRIVDEYQLVKPMNSTTYRLSIGRFAALSLGYATNNWVVQLNRPGFDSKTTFADDNGQAVYVKNALMRYSAPCYILGYHFIAAQAMSGASSELEVDEYDKKRKFKSSPCYLISGNIDLMYAPEVTAETQLLYSPYGYYVPRNVNISAPVAKRKFGFALKMQVTTPYLLGLYMQIGLLPSAFPTDVDNSKNISARAGVIINFSKGR